MHGRCLLQCGRRLGRQGVLVLLGFLLLGGCIPSGDNGSVPPPEHPAPQAERQVLDNLLRLYRTALLQEDIDRLQALLPPEDAPAQERGLRQHDTLRQRQPQAVLGAQTFLQAMSTVFRTQTITALDIPPDTV